MKKIFLIVIVSVAFGTSYSQSAKAVFFELGGPGLASLNFDTRFSGKEDGIGGRAGIGGFSLRIDDESQGVIFVPLGLNYILGKDKRNYFEVGAGVTFVAVSGSGTDNDGTFESTFGHLNFGYRLQPANGGFFFRAAINPIFGNGFFIPYYGGVSFGYKF